MSKYDKFRNKDGTFTAYALACGYVQRTTDGGDTVELYAEHGHYHVKHIHDDGYLDRDSWQVFDTLTEARAEYRAQVRRYIGVTA